MTITHTRPRVLQCISRLGLGGSERVAFSIMHALVGEIDFALFTAYSDITDPVGHAMEAELKTLGIPWFKGTKLSMKAGGMVPAAWQLRRCLGKFRPDFIHYHAEIPEACGAMMTLLSDQGARVPAIRTIHNSIFWRYWPRTGQWCDHRLKNARVVCVSEAAQAEFNRYRQQSCVPTSSATPPSVIYNGVALPQQAPHSQPHRSSARRILFAARLEWQKGPDILRAALPLVRLEPGIQAELVIHGQGADERTLSALAMHPPPQWTVTLRPPAAGLDRLLPTFDLVVMPSRFEGLPLLAVEATLCGIPIVATHAAGLREALPSSHPWLAEPGNATELADCLTRALRDIGRWADAVITAQRHARTHFSPETMAAGYRKLYTSPADPTAMKL